MNSKSYHISNDLAHDLRGDLTPIFLLAGQLVDAKSDISLAEIRKIGKEIKESAESASARINSAKEE